MSTVTPNYGLIKPGVGDPVDQDLWGGELNENMDTLDTVIKTVSDSVAAAGQLPIGSIYMNATDATNPGTLLGYGTWATLGAGRVLIGVGTGTDINGATLTVAGGGTGGEYAHAQTATEVANHSHTVPGNTNNLQTGSGRFVDGGASGPTNISTSSAGSGSPANVTQPYLGVYMWSRTA